MGIALGSSFRRRSKERTAARWSTKDHFIVLPGDDVKVMYPTRGLPPDVSSSVFTVVDFYESKMSEYDSSFVFVPIRQASRNTSHDRSDHPGGHWSVQSRSS